MKVSGLEIIKKEHCPQGGIRVAVFDFDGTFYSGEHKFDNVDKHISKNKRKFLPGIWDILEHLRAYYGYD